MRYHSKTEKISAQAINSSGLNSPDELIKSAENAFLERINELVDTAINEERYIILLTGPSASGKTTSSKKIAAKLEERGKKVNRISLDNFYKTRDEMPHWRDGSKNFESIESLDLKYFNYIISKLKEDGFADFPIFDFTKAERSDETFRVDFDNQTFLIFEGIHALNPLLSEELNTYKALKVYVSAHSDFVDENGDILLASRDLRLTRRLLRDTVKRSTSPDETFSLWDKVCKGEAIYIRPFKKLADIHINSTHPYEPLVYKKRLLAAFSQNLITESKYKDTEMRLKVAFRQFEEISEDLVPDYSLLKEFLV